MKIDFSPLRGTVNHLTLQIAIIILVPFVAGLFVKWILRKIWFPKSLANFFAVIALLFVFYKTLMLVLG